MAAADESDTLPTPTMTDIQASLEELRALSDSSDNGAVKALTTKAAAEGNPNRRLLLILIVAVLANFGVSAYSAEAAGDAEGTADVVDGVSARASTIDRAVKAQQRQLEDHEDRLQRLQRASRVQLETLIDSVRYLELKLDKIDRRAKTVPRPNEALKQARQVADDLAAAEEREVYDSAG